jgi:hypothetical protein
MSRRLNVLASHIAAAEPLDSQPGQQFSGDRGDGFVFTHPEAQHILTNEQRLAYEADGFIVLPGLMADQAAPFVERFEELLLTEKGDFPDGMQIVRDIGAS